MQDATQDQDARQDAPTTEPPESGPPPVPAAPSSSSYDSQAGAFSLAVPDGWIVDSQETLDQINARAAELGGPGVAAYTAGFRPAGPPGSWAWLASEDPPPLDVIAPFVLVQEIEISGEGQGRELIADWVIDDLAEESNLGAPVFDVETMTVVARGAQTVPSPPGVDAPARTMVSTTTGFVGRERVVYLHAYTDARIAEATAPAFEAMTGRFAFTEAALYVDPVAEAPGRDAPSPGVLNNPLVAVAIGAAACVLVVIALRLRAKAG